jgi:hypothetical protein
MVDGNTRQNQKSTIPEDNKYQDSFRHFGSPEKGQSSVKCRMESKEENRSDNSEARAKALNSRNAQVEILLGMAEQFALAHEP